MDNTSESSSTRPWLWVVEALASCVKIENSTIQGLIDVAPVVPSDFGENTRELVSRRSLEGLFRSAGGLNFDASSSLDSRLVSGVSRSCEDVLHQTFYEIPLSSPEIAGVEIVERDLYPFMTHKRSSSVKLELEQVLKESVIEGTHPCADLLKERSGLTLQNQDYQLPANDGKCNDLSKTDNESDVGAKQKSSSKEHSHTSIEDPDKAQHEGSKFQSEQEIDVQLTEPNAANPNPTRQLASCDEDIVDSFNGPGAEHPEMIDFAVERHEFLSSHYLSSHHFLANTEWRVQDLCMKCNEGGQLLVCKTTTCQLKVHESCLSKSAQFDGEGNLLCPFCAYSCAVSEYLEAKKKVFVAREELCIFLGKGIEDQAMELLEVYRKENNSSTKYKCETILVKDNGNDQLLGTAREDNQGHINEVNNVQFERSQQQAETPTLCDNVPPLCRNEGIVNNRIDTVLNGGEETGNMKNPNVLRVERVEESQEAADHVTVGDSLFCCVPFVKQNTTGEENQQELNEVHSTDRTEEPACAHHNEENFSEDDSEQHINSRYSMRSRKCKTQCKPLVIPLLRKRKKVPWTAEEETILMEGVEKFGVSDQQRMPWKQIWEHGSHVFLSERRPQDLKDKWKNICKAKRRLK
ncbi:hypothetical protein K1719_024312 [Acacia pycnantha]|nr:hypothetical protein K1719_024312 [Acacia pycnantha]